MPPSTFLLKVQKIGQTCLFELSWGQGQQLMATLSYPIGLTERYQEWQRVYLSFYKTVQTPLPPIVKPDSNTPMRGWKMAEGSLTPSTVNWHSKLVEAEAKLLNEFHRWLRSGELFEIRGAIAQASRGASDAAPHGIHVFLTCPCIELARFPWEVWEIGTDFAATGTIRILRTPATIHTETGFRPRQRSNGRARILAILGDETGLNFQTDRDAVHFLSRKADVTFVGWQPGQTSVQVKEQISRAIADEQGWDVLFFAGHSNETEVMGGELAIAPGTSIRIGEIAAQLAIAKERGLQVAIFNSCSGLNIAESLIDLGFSQVAVMREPIHNCVAQEFLVQFLRRLAKYDDVHAALLAACQFLRLEKNLTYPSAYLVPSLFCHPGAELFRIQPSGWKHHLRQGLPTRWEAIALTVCIALSLLPSLQEFLLDQRIWLQAVYRDRTGQVPAAASPPVVLVQVDDTSIRRDPRIAQPNPISRHYLADLVNRLTALNAQIIGIDYLLDRPIGHEQVLREALQTAVETRNSWIVFAALSAEFETENIFVAEESKIARRNWSLQGYIESFHNRLTLPFHDQDCRQACPFAYLLSLIHSANQKNVAPRSRPSLTNQIDLRTELLNGIQREAAGNGKLARLQRSRTQLISDWSNSLLNIPWLQPVIDFSIPPDRIYDRIAAWRVLNQPLTLPNLPNQIVIIMSGGYTEAGGIAWNQPDYLPVPAAVNYWRDRLPSTNQAAAFPNGNSENSPVYLTNFPGGEVHAYIIHHLLTQRLVIPIPDLWMIGIAALLAKGTMLQLNRHRYQHLRTRKQQLLIILGFAIATALYGLLGLQLYISAAILLPLMLPLFTFWLYVLPAFRRKSNA